MQTTTSDGSHSLVGIVATGSMIFGNTVPLLFGRCGRSEDVGPKPIPHNGVSRGSGRMIAWSTIANDYILISNLLPRTQENQPPKNVTKTNFDISNHDLNVHEDFNAHFEWCERSEHEDGWY